MILAETLFCLYFDYIYNILKFKSNFLVVSSQSQIVNAYNYKDIQIVNF